MRWFHLLWFQTLGTDVRFYKQEQAFFFLNVEVVSLESDSDQRFCIFLAEYPRPGFPWTFSCSRASLFQKSRNHKLLLSSWSKALTMTLPFHFPWRERKYVPQWNLVLMKPEVPVLPYTDGMPDSVKAAHPWPSVPLWGINGCVGVCTEAQSVCTLISGPLGMKLYNGVQKSVKLLVKIFILYILFFNISCFIHNQHCNLASVEARTTDCLSSHMIIATYFAYLISDLIIVFK